jgi:hypothetical protein
MAAIERNSKLAIERARRPAFLRTAFAARAAHTEALHVLEAAAQPTPSPNAARARTALDPLGYGTRGYRAVAELVAAPPGPRTLDEVAAILGSGAAIDPRLAGFHRALADVDVVELLADWRTVLGGNTMHCADPGCGSRSWACVATDLAPSDRRTTDLLAIAAMGERAAWADRTGSSALAAAVRDRRAAFLREHAASCLGILARRLSSASARVLVTAGRALDALIAADTG